MNYKRVYESIIARAKDRVIEGYKERHHIVPRCMGGCDDIENLVDLTPEEHYVCHQLLVKMHPDNIKLLYAAHALSKLNSSNHSYKRSNNKKYAWLRLRHSEIQKTGKLKICNCGTEFYVANYRLNRYKHFYCSNNCKNKYISEAKLKKVKLTNRCLFCKKEFNTYSKSTQKYCSYKCSGKVQSVRQGGVINLNCFICNKQFTRATSAYNKNKDKPKSCCSKKCYFIRKKLNFSSK